MTDNITATQPSELTDTQVKYMVDRFLGWRLPKDFNPDAGITFTRPNYHPDVDATPSGTNLFDATQADAMVRYLIDGLPVVPAPRAPGDEFVMVLCEPTDAALKHFGYAPGGYMTKCLACDETFVDLDKRATSCQTCAARRYKILVEAIAVATPQPAALPAQAMREALEFYANEWAVDREQFVSPTLGLSLDCGHKARQALSASPDDGAKAAPSKEREALRAKTIQDVKNHILDHARGFEDTAPEYARGVRAGATLAEWTPLSADDGASEGNETQSSDGGVDAPIAADIHALEVGSIPLADGTLAGVAPGPSEATQPDATRGEAVRVDYRKFMEWVGLNGPRPLNAELAFYLEIELGNREEVDAVEAAVILEAIEVLKATPPANLRGEVIEPFIHSLEAFENHSDSTIITNSDLKRSKKRPNHYLKVSDLRNLVRALSPREVKVGEDK